ncbi:peptidase C65 Otubain-domain-containing protein [Dactylonectria estremocensis]|uniref:ubiquitinyl hydrolase 1 n=1 Tax=Dactylonectria estremocensis TaxID=1079267 RepID=A0A9P9IPA5_9HYPO|nr:peptidase C65 Otubain-domain-containing protein [Dactylonectria estremocensis]
MFQPQPTPFASSCFASSFGLAPELGFGYPETAGGGGPIAPGGSPYDSQLERRATAGAQLLRPQQQQQPLHLQRQQQQQQSSASPVASSSYAQSAASTTSPPPHTPTSLHAVEAHYQHQHQHQDLQLRQHQHQHHLQQHQHQQEQYQQHLNQQHHVSQHQHNTEPRQAPHQPYPSSVIIIPKMEDQQGQHDIAAQQAAAKDYQAVLKGPLVGNRVSSEAITSEYAKADQVYVEKTIALPQTFSHYRPIQGDGNCGWRAIGFSYFEKLIESGDQGKIEGEVARLMSFSHMMSTVGGYAYFEEWADEIFGLLRELAQSMENPNSQITHLLLLERWNDASVSSSIIYYLRLLAATYLKANAATYDPFLPEVAGGVVGYCSQSIELVDREIEHLGIVALVHMLLEPNQFVLEIVYLDRSPGSQANRYRFPEEANGQDPSNLGPIIYLLYRPDHYDILYLSPPVQVPIAVSAAPMSIHVNRVNSLSSHTPITSTQTDLGAYSSLDYGALSMIPSFSPMGMAPLAPPPPTSAASVQSNAWMTHFSDGLPASTSQPQSQPQPAPAVMASPQPPSPPASMSTSATVVLNPPMVATSGLGPQSSQLSNHRTNSNYHIRFSQVQLEYEESQNSIEPHFNVKTNTFKNSIWNRAHYGNPDFHPEEWSPDDEHVDGRVGGKRKMKKESS